MSNLHHYGTHDIILGTEHITPVRSLASTVFDSLARRGSKTPWFDHLISHGLYSHGLATARKVTITVKPLCHVLTPFRSHSRCTLMQGGSGYLMANIILSFSTGSVRCCSITSWWKSDSFLKFILGGYNSYTSTRLM